MPAVPEIVGHRGSPRVHRENTLPSFQAAIAEGATAIELDVHATRDGHVVVHHDPVLPPGTTPAAFAGRALAELALAELEAVRLPGPGHGDYRVRTLPDVLAAVGPTVTVYVEVKARGIEALVLGAIAGAPGRTAVHAFDHRVARRVADAPAAPPTGILLESYLVDPAHALRAAGARDYWAHWKFVDRELVERVHAAGGRVVAWTVNDLEVARHFAAIGVDALCTDTPRLVREALGG